MSYLNFIKEREIALPNIKSGGVGGEFKLEAFQGFEFPKGSGIVYEYPGTRRLLMDWASNHIVDQGLDHWGGDINTDPYGFGYVGSGNTPPTDTDAGLETYIAYDQDNGSTTGAQGSAPYFGHETPFYRFSPGFGGGDVNIDELGVGTTSSHNSLTARCLTVNGAGTPTSISVLGTEYLDMYYKRRNYPAHIVEATGAPTDDTGIVNIQGTNYTYTIRPALVTVGGSYSTGTSDGWGSFKYPLQPANGFSYHTGAMGIAGATDCTLGAVTGALSATQTAQGSTDEGKGTYTADTYNRELWWQWGISNANDVGGIGGLLLKTNMGAYQMTFSANVPKVYGEVFTFYHSFSWDRKTTWV